MLTKQDIFDLVEEEDVRFIRLQFTDMLGTMRNLAITTSRLEDALDNLCMFDGSSIMGFVGVEESDLYLHPDFDTFEIFPWRPHQGKVARLICDVYKPDGTRLESDPRYILQTVVKEAEEMGYKFNVGPECEFFLFNTDERGNPTTEPHDNAGYFDLAPLDNGENCRREICLTLEDMDTYNTIGRRTHKEDVLSIVKSSFMPVGIETDHYAVIGTITSYIETTNS